MSTSEDSPSLFEEQPDRFMRAYGNGSFRSDEARWWRDSLGEIDIADEDDAEGVT